MRRGKRGRPVLEISLLENPFLFQEAWPAKSSRNIHTRSRTLPSQTPHLRDVGAMLFSIGTMTLGFVLELTVLSAFREFILPKGIKSWAEVMLLTELSLSFQNFQQFSSVRLAKLFPLLNCCCLELADPLHSGFIKVSLYFKHWISSSPTPMCFENIFHWIREGHYSTRYNPQNGSSLLQWSNLKYVNDTRDFKI